MPMSSSGAFSASPLGLTRVEQSSSLIRPITMLPGQKGTGDIIEDNVNTSPLIVRSLIRCIWFQLKMLVLQGRIFGWNHRRTTRKRTYTGQRTTNYKMGPAGVEPATNQAEYIAMRYLSVSSRLLLSEPCMHLSMHTALQGYGLLSRIPLY